MSRKSKWKQTVMKVRGFNGIESISLSAILIASIFIITASSGQSASASGSNRFVVWADTTPGNADIFFRRSADSGATWQAIKNLSNNAGGSYNPELAVYGSNVYVTWLQANSDGSLHDIFFRRSTDNGATWGSEVNLSKSGEVYWSPEMAVSGSYVHVVWTQPDPDSIFGGGQVFIRSSANGGSTWNSAENLTSENADFTNLRIDSAGSNVYVLYRKFVNAETAIASAGPLMKVELTFLAGRDNGATWKPPVVLDEWQSDEGFGAEPELLALGSNVYVVWGTATGYSDGTVFFRRSTDNGDTWGPTSSNLNNTWRLPHDLQLAAAGSSVYIIWYKQYPSDVFFLRSTDNGSTWQSVQNLSNSDSGKSFSPEIAV